MRSPAEWPIRWRLTLVFSAAMALVLAAAGAVTVVQFRDAAHEADPDGALAAKWLVTRVPVAGLAEKCQNPPQLGHVQAGYRSESFGIMRL